MNQRFQTRVTKNTERVRSIINPSKNQFIFRRDSINNLPPRENFEFRQNVNLPQNIQHRNHLRRPHIILILRLTLRHTRYCKAPVHCQMPSKIVTATRRTGLLCVCKQMQDLLPLRVQQGVYQEASGSVRGCTYSQQQIKIPSIHYFLISLHSLFYQTKFIG